MKLGLLSLHPAILPGSAQLTSSTLTSHVNIGHVMSHSCKIQNTTITKWAQTAVFSTSTLSSLYLGKSSQPGVKCYFPG